VGSPRRKSHVYESFDAHLDTFVILALSAFLQFSLLSFSTFSQFLSAARLTRRDFIPAIIDPPSRLCARVCVSACVHCKKKSIFSFISIHDSTPSCVVIITLTTLDSEPNHRVDDAYIVGFHTARKTVSSLHCGDVHHTCPLQLKYYTSLHSLFLFIVNERVKSFPSCNISF